MDPYAALTALSQQRRNGFDYNSIMPTFRRFVANGTSPMDAAAITGNFAHEANIGGKFTPGAVETNAGAGHGMGQWTGSRWNGPDGLKQFANNAGSDWRNPQTQMDFFKFDAAHNKQASRALDAMQSAPTLGDKTDQFMMGWERPKHSVTGDPSTYMGRDARLEHAQNILDRAGNYGPQPASDPASLAMASGQNNPAAFTPPASSAPTVQQIDPYAALSALTSMSPKSFGFNF